MTINQLFSSEPLLLSRKEAAAFLGVSESTLAVWTCTKRYSLPYIKVGRLVKYTRKDLLSFLESRKVGGE